VHVFADDLLQTRSVQSSTAVSQLADEPGQPPLLAQMSLSLSATDQLKPSSDNVTLSSVDEEDMIEELVLLHCIFSYYRTHLCRIVSEIC